MRRGPRHDLRLSRLRTLQLAAAGAFAALALRPIEPLERGLDGLLAPVRLFGELTRPIGQWQGRAVFAAEDHEAELAERERLEAAVVQMAQPRSDALLRGLQVRGVELVRAEVIARPDGALDQLLVRVEAPVSFTEDLPVVVGDTYVGRLDLAATHELTAQTDDLFVVRLVTGSRFRIGARTEDGACRMVVGGVAALPSNPTPRLGVHNPSDRRRREGTVVVSEPDLSEGRGDLANGFYLGELVYEASDPELPTDRLLGLAPGLDYATGLHQLVVLTPESTPFDRELEEREDPWRPIELFLRAETSPHRFGRTADSGRLQGVHAGAALRSGMRFAGRILRSGILDSDVALVGDPGLQFPALAWIEDGDGGYVHVLGRVTCLRRRGDRVVLHWPATTPLIASGSRVRARLWTGSGDGGVPRGLIIGDTELPTGEGPHELIVTLPEREPKGLAVHLLEGAVR